MLKPQWNKIKTDNSEEKSGPPVKLHINSGRLKGSHCKVLEFNDNSANVILECGKRAKIGYPNLDLLDHEGNPVSLHMKDMLGADIEPYAIVCYSQSSGGYGSSHALEIGRVSRVSPSGTLLVRPLVRNAEKLPMPTRFNWTKKTHEEAPRKVDANRCMKIPVDVGRLMMGVMTDFDNLGSDHNG
ncbi:MAG: hypothetical protein EOO77_31245 [Oxalobacteraceae bacterium]|nr:MAG: hypothetical protein EOO77_31245 [Oxalobacteraceae bacterium]